MRTRHIAALVLAFLWLPQGPAIARAQTTPTAFAAHPHADFVSEAAQRFGIPAPWIVAVMRAESANDPRAVSRAGAMGLMQVMPATWADLRARLGLGQDPFDPRDNILAGTAYLREMWDRYGTVAAMLAAYNAGPGRIDAHLDAGDPLPAETRAYVAALVPVLGGSASPDTTVVAQALPPDWREAALFVQRSGTEGAPDLRPEGSQAGVLADGTGIFVLPANRKAAP